VIIELAEQGEGLLEVGEGVVVAVARMRLALACPGMWASRRAVFRARVWVVARLSH
jgi:hypothetical protein